MNDSGSKREFPSGSHRDNADNKPRMELLPMELLMRVSNWYGMGAKKYGDNDWRKGQPTSAVIGSLLRHLTKYMMGMKDEDHLSAILWNGLALMNIDEYYNDDPLLNDTKDWFKDGKPTGKGSYLNDNCS